MRNYNYNKIPDDQKYEILEHLRTECDLETYGDVSNHFMDLATYFNYMLESAKSYNSEDRQELRNLEYLANICPILAQMTSDCDSYLRELDHR
jgi:hypothetical protein